MDEKIRKELETIEMEHQIGVIRHDLPGDALQSARLVLAAKGKKWNEVKKLLDGGQTPESADMLIPMDRWSRRCISL